MTLADKRTQHELDGGEKPFKQDLVIGKFQPSQLDSAWSGLMEAFDPAQPESGRYDAPPQFDLRDLVLALRLVGMSRRGGGYLEEAIREASDAETAPLKAELAILKNRVNFLYELRTRERAMERALDVDKTRQMESDLERIRNTLGSKISKEDVVRAVREGRDSR